MRSLRGVVEFLPIEWTLLAAGWYVLDHGTFSSTFYRWETRDGVQYRVELHLVFDTINRLRCWSEWHNRQTAAPDHDKGRLDRLAERARRAA